MFLVTPLAIKSYGCDQGDIKQKVILALTKSYTHGEIALKQLAPLIATIIGSSQAHNR